MKKKILIVEDEEEALRILEKKLTENNYLVMTATKGQEALDMYKISKPDLILLDIGIPDIDGYAVAEALREDKAIESIPIIFMTGKELDFKVMEERIAQLEPCSYITKPFSFQDILAKIAEAGC